MNQWDILTTSTSRWGLSNALTFICRKHAEGTGFPYTIIVVYYYGMWWTTSDKVDRKLIQVIAKQYRSTYNFTLYLMVGEASSHTFFIFLLCGHIGCVWARWHYNCVWNERVPSAFILQMQFSAFERTHQVASVVKISHWFIKISWRSVYELVGPKIRVSNGPGICSLKNEERTMHN